MQEVTLESVAAKVAALDTTQLEGLEAARADISNDLTTLIAAQPAPVSDPVATVVVTTAAGVVTTCVPQTA